MITPEVERQMIEASRSAGARLIAKGDSWAINEIVADEKHTRGFKAGDAIVPFWRVRCVLVENIERHEATIVTVDGEHLLATGFDAIEVVWWFKPSALEGRRLRWVRHAWAFHNIVAHPLMQALAWLGMPKTAIRLHDATTPRPR